MSNVEDHLVDGGYFIATYFDGQKIYKSLKEAGVYVDWRKPDVMRIAAVPLYNSFEDIAKFYHILFKCI